MFDCVSRNTRAAPPLRRPTSTPISISTAKNGPNDCAHTLANLCMQAPMGLIPPSEEAAVCACTSLPEVFRYCWWYFLADLAEFMHVCGGGKCFQSASFYGGDGGGYFISELAIAHQFRKPPDMKIETLSHQNLIHDVCTRTHTHTRRTSNRISIHREYIAQSSSFSVRACVCTVYVE